MPSESARLESLRHRVEASPASIVFAQLADEYRHAGRFEDAVACCRRGLVYHPGHLTARVVLGLALIELGSLDEAAGELQRVLNAAPDQMDAARGLEEIDRRRRSGLPSSLPRTDFDALLAGLGVPDLEPPPLAAMLLSDDRRTAPIGSPTGESGAHVEPDNGCAPLEPALRREEAPPGGAGAGDDGALAALEARLEALVAERTRRGDRIR